MNEREGFKMQDYEDILLFRIDKSYEEVVTAKGLYEATRGTWRISINRAETIKYAIAVAGGEVKEVYEIDSWHIAGTTKYETRPYLNKKNPKRKEFIGRVAKGDIRKLIGREIGYWGQTPFRYTNLKELMKK